ncbi:MAG: anthranilate synthase component I family protein [Balneola sp.]|nr:MAG: anthranilate synthase component I family protein [Balneola sp.]
MNDKEGNINALIEALSREGDVILLESQKEDHPESKTSFLAGRPKAWIKADGGKTYVFENGNKTEREGNIWEQLLAFRKRNEGWLFGYLGYDLKNSLEDLQSENSELISAPDMYFMVPDYLEEFSFNKSSEMENRSGFELQEKNRIDKEDYISRVVEAKKLIGEGDFYEINLSHALEFDFSGNPLELYGAMKGKGSVPFGAYLSIGDLSICCSSPERFLRRKANKVISQPIKGTISRNGIAGDEKLRLLHSEKNRAENLMIVDLVRNDLSRVAKNGSVNVQKLFEIQSFETLHQMVSTVECEVSSETDSLEIIKSCFPMGSMTGAPKIAAMQSIEEFEDYKRGIYSGAIGYIAPNGDFDFNVVIRTAIIQNQRLVYPVGGAITADSVPEEEWQETLVKAKALTTLIPNYKNE